MQKNRVRYNQSENLDAVLHFVNWWYTSEYGQNWFTDVAGVVPPIVSDAESTFEIINQGAEHVAEKGASICRERPFKDKRKVLADEVYRRLLAAERERSGIVRLSGICSERD